MLRLQSEEGLSILQWNCLADHLCTAESFPQVNPELLKFSHRAEVFATIFPHIIADIIFLEEVDHPDFFRGFLPQHYESHFKAKAGSTDGIFFAYNTHKFKKHFFQFTPYITADGKEQTQFYAAALLESTTNGQRLLAIGTHLKAKTEFDEVRVGQLKQIIEFIAKFEQDPTVAIVIVGDFNAEPTDPSVVGFKEATMAFLRDTNPNKHITTFKLRKFEECRTIDYIHYRFDRLTLIATNRLLSKEEIGPIGLPSKIFPSDHLYLFALFGFKKE